MSEAVGLSEVGIESLLCARPRGHWWDEINPSAQRGRRSLAHLGDRHSWLCVKCKKLRHEVWHRVTGALVDRWYENPPNYVAISRDFKVADLRLELIRRWKQGESPSIKRRRRN